MKKSNKLIALVFSLFLMASCGKKDADPMLEIYVSAKKSELYQDISMNHGYIRLFNENKGISNIQQYAGIDVSFDLSEDTEPVLVGNESHWEDSYIGLNASLSSISATTVDGVTIKANTPIYSGQQMFGGDFDLLENKRYRIYFDYDIDASIILEDDRNIFDTVVDVRVEEF
ncbi:MAG: hypothetical protein P1U56_17685 [Saprospiraceae bacterium]|nr:hypothetical protein [Saprospiraceae bacterium]